MFRILSKSAKRAEILIYGDIGPVFWGDEVSAADFARTLKDAGEVDEIDLRINSLGGDVFDGLAIYRQLVDHKARVNVHIDGIAASIASVIAMAGDSIVIAQPARMMIHDAMSGVILVGTAERLRTAGKKTLDDLIALLDTQSQEIADLYAARSGKPAEKVRADMIAETWFTAKEAVAYGLADAVAANKTAPDAPENATNIVPFNAAKHKFRNMPPELASSPGRRALADMIARQQVALTLSRVAASAKKR